MRPSSVTGFRGRSGLLGRSRLVVPVQILFFEAQPDVDPRQQSGGVIPRNLKLCGYIGRRQMRARGCICQKVGQMVCPVALVKLRRIKRRGFKFDHADPSRNIKTRSPTREKTTEELHHGGSIGGGPPAKGPLASHFPHVHVHAQATLSKPWRWTTRLNSRWCSLTASSGSARAAAVSHCSSSRQRTQSVLWVL